ncbi:DinB family protein [Aquincola sp. J276]|uniref:DinB family protein n=1 Tax=Aquincola sp. J276 TaxID=2898432 RepID=UPI002150E5AE|nr:DinB family protein [Aquincola sp. J276]MCR5868078.1 DinB family protein [Aquincola sp. J276]
MSTASLLLKLFRHKAWADDELLARVAQLDEATQAAERHAAVRLLNHIHVVDRIFAAHLAGTSHGFTATNTSDTPTLPTLAAAMAETDRWYLAHIDGLDAQALAQVLRFTFTDGSAGAMSREEMLAHVATHGGYHRGAVGRVLSQAGITPPRDLLTGHLHLTEPARRVGHSTMPMPSTSGLRR